MNLAKRTCLLLLLLVGVACTSSRAFREAREEETMSHWDLAVLKYAQALELDPTNSRYQISLQNVKRKASHVHFERGKIYRNSGQPELAVVELEQTIALDPTNHYAENELAKARDEAAKAIAERTSETRMQTAKRNTRGARARAPQLEPTSDRPINLNFPQPKPIKQIYQSLALAAGINVIFDPQLKDENVSIVLTNIPFLTALETLMRQENHFYKVIDEKTFLIAADTPQNRKTYEDLVIRTFFLSNGDVTEVSNALRSLLQTTRISINKAENSITLRDTADKVAIAEKIVDQNDKQLAEVVIDVELLQINTTKATDIGLLLSPYSVGASIPAPGGTTDLGVTLPGASGTSGGAFTWDQLRQLSIRSFGFTIPTVTYNFIKNNSESELLAKPQLRISEGQKAQLVIGDKIPIPTTTFNTANVVGSSIVPVTSFQYQDVGIKIEVEPRVHHNKEVTLKLTLEVSQLGAPVDFGGQKQPTIGTRTISSNIRLRDGETNFLAGLFRTDKSRSNTTVPFFGDVPILGRLFSNKSRGQQTTDLVLTLTPHIVRIPDVTEEDLTPVYVGTDSNISYQGSPRIESPGGSGPFDLRREPPAPRSVPVPNPAGALPAPQNLAPSSAPSNPFSPRQSIPPQPTPGPAPVPQGASRQGAAAEVASRESAAALAVTDSAAQSGLAFDFAPGTIALTPGEQRSVLVRATGQDGAANASVTVRFDPAFVRVVGVRTILPEGGVGEASVQADRIVVQMPGPMSLTGTRAIAEVVIQGVKAGQSRLAFERNGSSADFAEATVDVR